MVFYQVKNWRWAPQKNGFHHAIHYNTGMKHEIHALYCLPPASLATAHADAFQCSPIIPGSAPLDEMTDHALVSLLALAPPGTIERRYMLASGLRGLAPGAPLTVLAPNDKGGNRIAGELRAFGCEVEETSRQHHKICRSTRPETLTGIDAALAAGAPQQRADGLWTQPGVFSWDRIDTGTALLLEHLPALSGRGADLGCGIGILARAALANDAVTELDLIDTDLRALNAAVRNVIGPRAHFHWADIRTMPDASTNLDFILMNPPFHDGGTEDQSLGQHFIARAAEMLRPGGTCWLTANRHLPYEKLLAQRFARVALVAEASGYKIYAATR